MKYSQVGYPYLQVIPVESSPLNPQTEGPSASYGLKAIPENGKSLAFISTVTPSAQIAAMVQPD